MKSRHLLSVVTAIIITASSSFSQEIPQMIYYQGSLADASGKPVNGSHNITFSIWSAVSGGSKIWEETHNTVPVSNGLFSIILGSKNHITIDDFSSKQRYLQIVISGETLSPRQRIASVPYSHTAGSVSGSTNVMPSNGNAGFGTTDPQSKLHIKMQGENKLQLPLRLVNPDGTDAGGTATGILFETETGGFGKGALVYERKSDWGNGSFHFLQNTQNNESNPSLSEAVVTIKNDGDMEIEGTVHSKEGGFKFPDGSVQVSAAGSGGTADNLGNHTATQNLNLNGHWLSGDGGNEGVFVKNDGNAGIGTNNPSSKLEVAGTIHSTTGGVKFPDGSVQVSAAGTGGTADNLGNHTATQNLNLNGHWLSGDGGSEGVFVRNNGKAGIGTNNPSADLQVNGTDGVLFTGTYESGSIPVEGIGTRMMWYPKKAAFRAGFVGYGVPTAWDDANIGAFSVAMGYTTRALGAYSTAIGNSTLASGMLSTAMGERTTASGGNSTAMGSSSAASGEYSTAMGNSSKASGWYSTAMCNRSEASGESSTAMGHWSIASGDYSIAMGRGTEARGYCNMAIGKYNTSGNSTADSWVPEEYIFTIGDGTVSNGSNILFVRKNGNMWIQGSLTENSDRRLKKDIEPLYNTVESLKQLNGVSFRWKDSENMGDDLHNGIIAQDVEKVYPYLVGENEGYKTLNYNGIIPVLVEAVKEQQKIIEKLQNRIEALEK